MADRIVLCIGTKKGLFVAESSKTRRSFALRGPFGAGVEVYSALIETRGSPRIYASSCNPFFGMKVLRSTNLGKSSLRRKPRPLFPRTTGARSAEHLVDRAGRRQEGSVAGVGTGGAFFRSEDNGDSWEMVAGISNHAHARQWQPGNGGLCMHTIVRDGKRVHLGISTGGHYLSEDGGATFTRRTTASAPASRPIRIPSSDSASTRSRASAAAPGRLCMQNHGGWAKWTAPADHGPTSACCAATTTATRGNRSRKGLPSDFGFPMVVHPHDPDTIYVVPLETQTRTCPGGAPAVWRSENGGDSWSRLARGYPKKRASSPCFAMRWTSII